MDNDILKSIEEDMKKQSNAFNEVNTQINVVYNEYNTKLAEIEKEGNTKIKELQNKREQIRGAYTVLLNQYNKFTTQDGQTEEPVKQEDVKEPENKEPENKERAEVVETPKQEKQEKQEQPKRGRKPKVQKADTNTGLSKADMEKLKQLEKYGEAPDYLKDQYNN